MANNSNYLPPRNAAQHLNMSKNFLDKARLTGIPAIPFIKMVRKVLYDIKDLDAFMQSKKQRWIGETIEAQGV